MGERLKVVTWLWAQPGGRTAYTDFHVRVWRDMIERHLTLPHTLGVVTDLPGNYGPDVEVIEPPTDFLDVTIPTWKAGRPQCFRRLSLFRRDAAGLFDADRIVNTDLDIIVSGSLDALFSGEEDFRIMAGTAAGRRFNGSLFMVRLGSRPQVYEEFTQERAAEAGRKHVGSDQSWLAHILDRGEKVWTPRDGVVSWHDARRVTHPRLVAFPGSLKPWHMVGIGETFAVKHYRRSNGGRCLVLGYAPSVWMEAAAIVRQGAFDAVIASPETAAHWPGEVLAVAADDAQAERIAAMHGLEPVWCGRSGGVPV